MAERVPQKSAIGKSEKEPDGKSILGLEGSPPARGGSPIARGGSPLARGGSPIARGGSQIARGGSQIARGGSPLPVGAPHPLCNQPPNYGIMRTIGTETDE